MHCRALDNGGCEQQCLNNTDGGYICHCYPGYIISDENRKRCINVNATGTHTCSHLCKNLNGSYSCSCRDGFRASDGLSGVCRATKKDITLVFANGPEIRAYDLTKQDEFNTILMNKIYIHTYNSYYLHIHNLL